MHDSTYHMSEDQQFITLVIAALVVFVIGLGIKAIVHDILNKDEVEQLLLEQEQDQAEFESWYLLDRDQHERLHLQGWSD